MTDLTFDLTRAELLNSTGSLQSNKLRTDPVTGLVDYFLDIKPFHTKLLETIIEYINKDLIRVTVTEVIKNKIHLSFPGCLRFFITKTNSPTVFIINGNFFLDPTKKVSIVKDGVIEEFISINSKSYVAGIINETTLYLNTPIINHEDFIGGELLIHCKSDDWCEDGFGLSSFGSSSVYPAFYPGGSQVPVSIINKFIVIPGNHIGRFTPGTQARLYFQVMDNVTFDIIAYPTSFDVYTVQNSAHFYGMIPGRTISSNPSTLNLGIDPYTIITFTNTFTGIPVPGPGQTLIAYAELLPLVITSIIPYSNISNIPGVMSEFALPDNIPDENIVLNIGSNAFVIPGNKVAGFNQGVQFKVTGGANDGTYHVLYSDLVSGNTRIRPIEDIRHLGAPGQITFKTLGYSETDEFCPKISGTTASVKIREKLTFIGLGIDLFDEIIAYNLENKDVIGYEYPNTTIVSELEPFIISQSPDPLFSNPLLQTQSLWFNTNTLVLYQLQGSHWVERLTIFWMKIDSLGNYIQMYRRTKGIVDTGWIEDIQGGYNTVTPAYRVKFDIISISGSNFVISGNPTNIIPNIVGSSRIIGDSLVGQDFQIGTFIFNSVQNTTTFNGVIPIGYLNGQLVMHTKNAFVYPFGTKPYQVFHSYVEGNNDIISLDGGNYLSRFMLGTNFSAKVIVSGDEKEFDDLKVKSWVSNQLGPNNIEIVLDNPSRLSMFSIGSIIEITRTKNTSTHLQVSSIGTLVGNTLPMTVIGNPTEISSVLAGVFTPSGPNGNPRTSIVVNSIPSYDSMDAIWYDMKSPILFQIFNLIGDAPVNIPDSLSVSNEMILTENSGNLSQNLAQSYIYDTISFDWGVEGLVTL